MKKSNELQELLKKIEIEEYKHKFWRFSPLKEIYEESIRDLVFEENPIFKMVNEKNSKTRHPKV